MCGWRCGGQHTTNEDKKTGVSYALWPEPYGLVDSNLQLKDYLDNDVVAKIARYGKRHNASKP